MRLSWGEVATATRGRILAGDSSARSTRPDRPDRPDHPARPDRSDHSVPPDHGSSPIDHWSIDTRTLTPGAAFVAIVGPSHDAHRFLEDAAAAGASGVVVSDEEAGRAVADRLTVVLVDDTTRALQDLALHVREREAPTVLAITGSVGKTTTKELTRLLVAGDRATHASPGNLNNHYGLPLALLGMPDGTDAVVLELGISTPGEMDRLVEIARPDLGLVTRIAAAHVGNFASFDDLADEKMKLPAGSARAVLNADDPAQWSRRGRVASLTSFGESEAAQGGLRLLELHADGLEGVRLVASWKGQRIELECPLAGAHQGRNLLAAAALALEAGVAPEVVVARAPLATPGAHRGEVLELARGAGTARVVDDSYNANPAAVRAAIALLRGTSVEGRRILVAGDMRELGRDAEAEHRAVGREAAEARLDVVVGVGADAAALARAAGEGGAEAHELADAAEAGAWLARELRAGDVALVKGSRAVALDEAVAHLARTCGAAPRRAGGGGGERGAA